MLGCTVTMPVSSLLSQESTPLIMLATEISFWNVKFVELQPFAPPYQTGIVLKRVPGLQNRTLEMPLTVDPFKMRKVRNLWRTPALLIL